MQGPRSNFKIGGAHQCFDIGVGVGQKALFHTNSLLEKSFRAVSNIVVKIAENVLPICMILCDLLPEAFVSDLDSSINDKFLKAK